jgi:hypothetical protein
VIIVAAIVIPYVLGIFLSICRIQISYYPRPGYISSFAKRFGKYGCIAFWPFVALEEIIRKFV